jgi:SAM-dependent methyltransferase
MASRPELSIRTGAEAWDTIWKWTWFTRDQWKPEFRRWKEGTRLALRSLLPKLKAKSILDCSCGLGWKSILLAEMGYEVEACDGSAFAVRCASALAEDEGLELRCFRSRWEDLGRTCGRKYDCVYNDAFAWITTRKSLAASARAVCSVLKRGGAFIFQGADQWSGDQDKEPFIRKHIEKQRAFEILPVHEKDGVRLTVLIAREMTPDGVLGSRIHIVEDHGRVRVEVARVLDCAKWHWSDYVDVFDKAGFRNLYSVKERGAGKEPYVLNVAVK